MREPSERMPITGITDIEGPQEVLPTQACVDMRVIYDVLNVVVIDKIVIVHRPIKNKCR